MSTERIIHLADLTFIVNSLQGVQNDVGVVSNQVETVGQELLQTRSDLTRLEQAFMDFVAADLKAKNLALAETRQVKIRQELENRFGYYAVVRRHATGVLQASDTQLVRQETLREATEELMLSAPAYWLAPALVALAAWLGDNKDLAHRALAEAIRRDDEKTSLFFALVCRRAGRNDAHAHWLDRYFGLQNPSSLDRQTVVMIDAVANGVFGPDVGASSARRVADWIEELSQRAGFIDAQRRQWDAALRSKTPNDNHATRYPHLAQFSANWAKLNESVNGTALHAVVLSHFQGIFDGAIVPPTSLLVAVDDLLSKLVTRFDDEELPLRRQEELCGLIIAEDGDKRTAEQRFELQRKALDETVDFTQLLTNAAMHPETSHASRATQRFAIAHSRDWVLQAHQDLTARTRMAVPAKVEIAIEDWTESTAQGENEKQLVASLQNHLDGRKKLALDQVKMGLKEWAVLIFGVCLLLAGFSNGLLFFVLGAGCLAWSFIAYQSLEKARKKIRADFDRLTEQSTQALKAVLAETVELRRDIAARDAVAAQVDALLQAISPAQYILSSQEKVRRVMTAGATPQAQ